ncbi:MAG: glycosyltransferase family 2 protein [Proteobacteria bacterium]|nr:glycosyltransferase family 2 protein [Pseudomonadota bacterium]
MSYSEDPHLSAPISVLMLAKNEGHRIARSLESLRWVGEVILLDNHSTDNTAAEANKFEHVKRFETDWLGYGETKRAGLRHAKYDWILWIDADEVVSPELREEILSLFSAQGPSEHAYDLPRCTNVAGVWIRHGGWYPDRIMRLFNKQFANFNSKVLHEGIELSAGSRIGHLKNDLLHYSYDSLDQFFSKMVLYGPLGAEQAFKDGKRFSLTDITLRPVWTFFKMYILKRGFLDGVMGFIVCFGSAFSTFIRYSHLYARSSEGRRR